MNTPMRELLNDLNFNETRMKIVMPMFKFSVLETLNR